MHCTVTKPSRLFPHPPTSIISYTVRRSSHLQLLCLSFTSLTERKKLVNGLPNSVIFEAGNLFSCRKGPGFWLLQESGLPLLLQSIAIIRLWNLPRSVGDFLCGYGVDGNGTDFNSVADPDPLVRVTDQGLDPDPSIIKQK